VTLSHHLFPYLAKYMPSRSKKIRWKIKKISYSERNTDGAQEILFEIGSDAEQIIAFIRR